MVREQKKKETWCISGRKQNGMVVADLQTVDICITTNFKDLEHVCLLAEVLAKRKFFLDDRELGENCIWLI